MASVFERIVEKIAGENAAQHVRRHLLRHGHGTKYVLDADWARDIVMMDIALREVGQREIYLREEAAALRARAHANGDDLTSTERSQLEKWAYEIEELARQYWHQEREFYRREASCPDGPIKRGFLTWRKNPDWYLENEFLRYDCAGRGGCCGRSCGCCEKPRHADREIRMGHCTVECGCCRRTRGFELSHEDKNKFKKLFDCEVQENASYINSLKLAYIFGLSK